MATIYAELQAEIQLWLDNNNPTLVAAIPSFIADAEIALSRVLETVDQECQTSTLLVQPTSACAPPAGEYELPSDMASLQAVYTDGTYLWINYLKVIAPLSDLNETNWLLGKYPDLYRYQSLIAAEGFLKNDPRIAVWREAAARILNNIELLSDRQRFGGSVICSRVPGQMPKDSPPTRTMLQVLPWWDFAELSASGTQECGKGYYSISGGRLHIWPVYTEESA